MAALGKAGTQGFQQDLRLPHPLLLPSLSCSFCPYAYSMAAASPGITSSFLPSGSHLYLTCQNKVTCLALVTRKSGKVDLAGYTVILDKTVTLVGRKKREKLGSGSH